MIRFENVTKRYDKTVAVDNIDFEIESGDFFVIIGPSGSGKTTILKMINKMVMPSKGKIIMGGRDISTIRGEVLRRKIGYVIQNIGLLPHMSVEENISIVPKLLKMDKKSIKKRALDTIYLVGLDEGYLRKKPNELSGGEAQRVGIARALAADPSIMLMDEPFGALDPITRLHLQNEIRKIQETLKKTIVFVTHDIDEAIKIATKIAIVENGRIVQIDSPKRLLSNPKDEFVAKFLGSDRALKKLSKFYVGDFKKTARFARKNSTKGYSKEIDGYLWVVDDNFKLLGWVDGFSDRIEFFTEVDYKKFALFEKDTLKDAISKMIWESVRMLPICDKNGKLIGEIDLYDIIEKT